MATADADCAYCQAGGGGPHCELAGIPAVEAAAGIEGRRYEPRQGIFAEGTPPVAAYCVRAGIVKLFKQGARGEPVIIRLLGAGHLIGYRAVLAGEPYAATAEAVDSVELCRIPQEAFVAILAASPLASRRLLAMMARELRISEELMLGLAHETVRARTVRLLINFLADTGLGQAAGGPVLVPLQRWELAQMLSTSPETLSRTLHRLAAEGSLQLTRTQIYVRDAARLRAIASGQLPRR